MVIEPNRGHYDNLEETRKAYIRILGSPVAANGRMYNYYINMVGVALEPHLYKKRSRLSRLFKKIIPIKFPYSISTQQELIRIFMIAQADATTELTEKLKTLKERGEFMDRGGLLQTKIWNENESQT